MPRIAPLAVTPLEPRIVPAAGFRTIAAGPGGGTASLIDPATGQPRFTVAPFGDGFLGGVRVAVGDVTGDTVADLITAPASGGGPHVRVFDGATGALARDAFAFDEAFTGGVNVTAGDVDKDGFADVVAAAASGGGPRVRVVSGRTGDTLLDDYVFESGFAGGVNVATADVDGDERADVVVGAGPGGGPRVRALTGAGRELSNFFAFEETFRGGAFVAAADLNADAFGDVIASAGPGGGPRVRAVDGRTGDTLGDVLALDPAGRTGARVGTWLADGAGANLRVLPGPGGTGAAVSLDGRTFASIADTSGSAAAGAFDELAAADPVLAWNDVLLRAIRDTVTSPPVASRAMAIASLAVYDAVNSIEGGYEAYRVAVPSAAGADVAAAVATAARDALAALFPTLRARFDAIRDAQLARVPAGEAKGRGVTVGQAAAAAILADRANDGATAKVAYAPTGQPGDWAPTPAAFKAALLPQWGQVTPFTVGDITVYRAPDAPALDGPEYAAAFNEVKAVGSKASPARTADQTETALFWAGNPGPTPTPPGVWNQVAARLARLSGHDVATNARTFARLNAALADAAIACWFTKYEDNFWRPVTAIRAADADGNPATGADPAWTPLLPTPNFPSNTSGHSTFSAAAAAVLGDLFGADLDFTAACDELPGVTRSFGSFAEAAAEAGMSRIYGGIHFQFDNAGGLAAGQKLGEHTAGNLLKKV